MPRHVFQLAVLLALSVLTPVASAARVILEEDYNQWKQALGTNTATRAEHLTARAGFQVELLRSAQTNEGSWVALTFDPQGRVVIAREDRGLLRMTLATNRSSVARVEIINTNLLECRGLLFAHGALYANANNSKAFVRLRDTDGDEQFDEIKYLRSTPGGVGHGRNQLALGPDGFIYSIHGDDVALPTNGVSASSPLRHYAEDRLLPCAWDKHLFNASASMPYGHLVRTDRDGATWEVIAGGLRNPFGLDFNAAGDAFTFDADMEWDVGLSWYHPTRVLHLVPGGDYGWRRGTGVLPVWSPDSLPSVVDIGVSSPTAIKFGTKSTWPDLWRSALFIQDWSYGKIIAVHLEKRGASYAGRAEDFLKGRPLNVTGLEFGPDGAMYFTTGGRRTQSGLYRVTWTGAPRSSPAQTDFPRTALALSAPLKPTNLWTRLNDPDHWVRYAARVELEARSVADWSERALGEKAPNAALTSLLALGRTGERAYQSRLVARVNEFARGGLNAEQQLIAVRALAVSFIRQGRPEAEAVRRTLATWEPLFPSADARVNQSLNELLIYLGSAQAVARTVPLLATAATQEEKFHYLFTLRLVTNGWSLADRKTYFDWLRRARTEFHGANMLPTALNYIRADAEATLTSDERAALRETLAALDARPAAPAAVAPRAFVQEWTVAELAGVSALINHRPDLARGKRLYAETGCAQCHRLGGEGGFIGPDLTAVSSRFDRRTLLESIIEPSKVVAEVYRPVTITLKSGAIYDGRVVSEDDKSLMIAINPADPDQRRRVSKADIATQRVSELSPMPANLLDTLKREEILDLLAWIESRGADAPR
jgi:putative heme-binding domain-containing protein